MGAISLGYGPDGKRIRRTVSGETRAAGQRIARARRQRGLSHVVRQGRERARPAPPSRN
ncbi:MAG: hypothetical protein ACRDPF_36720 [Streptosporangiaceae bacterium]